ncbi:MAG: endonuclease/exonuclease/phosphatase family protein [Anaerolineales bacterium]
MNVRVMSFNVRYATAEDGVNHWEKRRGLVVERIRAFGPDLLGLQECQHGAQADFLQTHLPDYGFAGVARGGEHDLIGKIISHAALEMTAVFYRLEAFELVAQGTFWLSKTPEVPGSKSWGSMFPRTVTWLRLRSKHPPFYEIRFFNAHLDHFSRRARQEAAKLICARMAFDAETPMVLTGDFNTLKDFGVYKIFTQKGLHDAYRQLHAPGRSNEGTFHDFGRIPPMPIDWILVSPHFEVLDAEIDRTHQGSLYPSDHYPIGATLTLKTPPPPY